MSTKFVDGVLDDIEKTCIFCGNKQFVSVYDKFFACEKCDRDNDVSSDGKNMKSYAVGFWTDDEALHVFSNLGIEKYTRLNKRLFEVECTPEQAEAMKAESIYLSEL